MGKVLSISSDSYRTTDWLNYGPTGLEPHLMKRLEYIIEHVVHYNYREDCHYKFGTVLDIIIIGAMSVGQTMVRLKNMRFKYLNLINEKAILTNPVVNVEDIINIIRKTHRNKDEHCTSVIMINTNTEIINTTLINDDHRIKIINFGEEGLTNNKVSEIIEYFEKNDK